MSEKQKPLENNITQNDLGGVILGACEVTIDPHLDRLSIEKEYLSQFVDNAEAAVNKFAGLIEEYSTFHPHVQALFEGLEQSDIYLDHLSEESKNSPDFIGHGFNSQVFRLTVDGSDYAVRVPFKKSRVSEKESNENASRGALQQIVNHAAASKLNNGIERIESLQAISFADGVTVSKYIEGKTIEETEETEEFGDLTREHTRGFVQTCLDSAEAGISLDLKPKNIIYSEDEGFYFVDVNASKPDESFFLNMAKDTFRRYPNGLETFYDVVKSDFPELFKRHASIMKQFVAQKDQ